MSDETVGRQPDGTSPATAGGDLLLGRYRLIRTLGRGGMGVVWLAWDGELERNVALKFLPEIVVRERGLLDDLKGEAKRSLELTHKNIVRIYDFVHADSTACISMEFVNGDTLSNLRADRASRIFEAADLADWTVDLCDALNYAHHHAGIVHRDLKPANLMVNQRGQLKIADFGISQRVVGSMSRVKGQLALSGTLAYMSPQQLDGKPPAPSDDIYSLGASLYELLTSKPPFYSGNVDRLAHEEDPVRMADRRRELGLTETQCIPEPWENVVAACLSKNPAQRPESAAEVARAIRPGSLEITSTRPTRLRRGVIFAVAVVVGLLLLILSILKTSLWDRKGTKEAARSSGISAPIAQPEKGVAVLPFESLSDDKENAYFADGIQDDILTDLSKVADLKIIGRTSVMHYRNVAERNLPEISRTLGVDYIVDGTARREGQTVHISVQLLEAATGKVIWGDRYERDSAAVFAIQSEIAEKIIAGLKAKLSPKEKSAIEERRTADLQADVLYVQANALLNGVAFNARVEKDATEAIRLLDQAVARDPKFVLAFCQLAKAHDLLYFLDFDHSPERLALAEKAVNTALTLRPDSGEAHLARADHLYHGYLDYDGARTEIAIARRTLPNETSLYELLGYLERRAGRWDESVASFERVLLLDPRNLHILQQLSVNYTNMRRFGETATILDRALELVPANTLSKVQRAAVYLESQANPKPLHDTIAQVVADSPGEAGSFSLEWLYLAACERDGAAAGQALQTMTPQGCRMEGVVFPHAWCEGYAALVQQNASEARRKFAAARDEIEKITAAQPDFGPAHSVLGLSEAMLGNRERAIREGKRAVELVPVSKDALNGAILLQNLAVIYAWSGYPEPAVRTIEEALKVPSEVSYGFLRLHPFWDPLRGNKAFEDVVAGQAPEKSR